ncbi:MAG: carbohydrate ABC transporter permease [Sphaerochaetaceae bacterium]|nr:carbohydrate ABC transporter permease [Sphaerochaetaceae bacterium]
MNNKIGDKSRGFGYYLVTLLLIIIGAMILLPIIFMAVSSGMTSSEIFTMPFKWIPNTFQFQNYKQAIAGNDGSYMFIRNVLNSIIVATITTILSTLISSFAGYGLAKFKFKGRNAVFMALMGRMMIPFEAIMIPMYITAVKLNLQNTYMGLILPFLLNAFGLFQLRQFLISFPDDMLDAGRIDGLGEMGIFWKLVINNSTPAVATAAIFSFKGQWDNLLWPLLVAQKEEMKTIPTYIIKFTEEKSSNEGAMMAVAALASLPMIIMFLSLSKYFLGGSMMYSASKE